MVVAVGSMIVKGVFKAGSLLTGLSSMKSKFKDAQQQGKSVTTEMKRMAGHAKMLGQALTGISVAGFMALMMTAPQLAGSLAKIKTELTLMAYAVGAKLKPALDAVGVILRGIRTGDWAVVKQGVKDLTTSLVELAAGVYTVVVDTIFGEGTAAKTKEAFVAWVAGIQEAWDTGTAFDLVKAIVWPVAKGVWNKTLDSAGNLRDKVLPAAEHEGRMFKQNMDQHGILEAMRDMDYFGKYMQLLGFDVLAGKKGEILRERGEIERAEYYEHKYGGGSAGEKPTTINIDFAGANINTVSEEDVETLADRIAKIFAIGQKFKLY